MLDLLVNVHNLPTFPRGRSKMTSPLRGGREVAKICKF